MDVDFDELLDNCRRLENTIQVVIKSNAIRQTNRNKLQAEMLKTYNTQQEELAELERKSQAELGEIKARSEKLEFEIKQVNTILDQLSDVVNRAQQATHVKPDASKKHNESYLFMGALIDSVESMKGRYEKVSAGIHSFEASLPKDSRDAKEILDESKSLVIELHKNANLIRLLERQGKFAEQQFDLILNQIPWEPLTPGYVKELRDSNNEDVRNMAETLALQVGEINDLNESLVAKKARKLEILNSLTDQLDLFVRRRGEAILMDGHTSNQQAND